MGKLAILGGTFNPVHWGHLLMAETARDQCQLDQVIWVPTHHPPHRSPTELVDTTHRVNMVKLAIQSNAAFTLSTVEIDRPGTSYAIDTLNTLKHIHPDSQWYWIIGLDAFQTLPRWYRHLEIAPQCTWLVAPRWLDICDPEAPHATEAIAEQTVQHLAAQAIEIRWMPLPMPRLEVSSGLIRHSCGDRRSIRYLVPDAVFDYITTHNLYR
jgi:nicotinate-nucleotide adenylyltransferase